MTEGKRYLNLGCGQNPIDGWVNLDWIAGPGVDLVADLEDPGCDLGGENSTDEVFASHLIEHIRDPLAMMQNLHHACKDGAIATFLCPYGSSDDADEDPTHVRRMFIHSWSYFSQPIYWRGNTEYVGDWRVVEIHLRVVPMMWQQCQVARPGDENGALNHLYNRIIKERNVVSEMVGILECVKPIRERKRELRDQPTLIFEVTEPEQPITIIGGVQL